MGFFKDLCHSAMGYYQPEYSTYHRDSCINLLNVIKLSDKIPNHILEEKPLTNYFVDWNTFMVTGNLKGIYGLDHRICHKSSRPLRDHLRLNNPQKGVNVYMEEDTLKIIAAS